MYSPRRSSGPYPRGGGATVLQTFDRSHPPSLSSAGDGQSSANQPPPRFSRRVEPTLGEQQRMTVAAAPTLTPQSIVVPAAVMQPPPQAPVALNEQTNPTPTRYMCSARQFNILYCTCKIHLALKLPYPICHPLTNPVRTLTLSHIHILSHYLHILNPILWIDR